VNGKIELSPAAMATVTNANGVTRRCCCQGVNPLSHSSTRRNCSSLGLSSSIFMHHPSTHDPIPDGR
jgi:hypothetical protein